MGKLINNLITPFTEEGEVCYDVLKLLLLEAESNKNDGLILFSLCGEGTSLSLEEKIEIYKFVKENTSLELYYSLNHLSLDLALKEIEFIKDLDINNIVITCPYFVKPSQDGIFLYYRALAKSLPNKKIFINNIPSRTGVNISFTTLKKLLKSQKNIIGLIESSTDLNLISLLKKDFPYFIVYLNEDKLIYEGLDKGVDGVVSSISIIFGTIVREIIEDYQIGFKNELIISYIKLVCEIMSEYDIPVNIKYYLEKKGFKNMNLRLPLVKVKDLNEDFNLLM